MKKSDFEYELPEHLIAQSQYGGHAVGYKENCPFAGRCHGLNLA